MEDAIEKKEHYECLNDLIERGKIPDEKATYILLYKHEHFIKFMSDVNTVWGFKSIYASDDEIKKYSFNVKKVNEHGGGYIDADEYLTKTIEEEKKTYPISSGGKIEQEKGYRLLYHITPKGTEIVDVHVCRDEKGRWSGYNFTIKETGFKSHTNYPWMIAENTPENLLKIKEYEEKDAELKRLKKEVDKLRDKIVTMQK